MMKADRVQERCGNLTNWTLEEDPCVLTRSWDLPTPRAALALAAYITEIAEALDRYPEILISGTWVTVTLPGAEHEDLTELDCDLAQAIDGKAPELQMR